jgi:hypothetical protein
MRRTKPNPTSRSPIDVIADLVITTDLDFFATLHELFGFCSGEGPSAKFFVDVDIRRTATEITFGNLHVLTLPEDFAITEEVIPVLETLAKAKKILSLGKRHRLRRRRLITKYIVFHYLSFSSEDFDGD